MRTYLRSFLPCLTFYLLTGLIANTFSQSELLIRSFEMIANGNGVINDVVGFDVNRPPLNYGAYAADWYRDVLESESTPASIINLPNGMQAGGGWYFIAAGPADVQDHQGALNRWTRNGYHDATLAGNHYEIRFTEAGGYAWMAYTSDNLVEVPFEVWFLNNTVYDNSDDIRMIPLIYDEDGNDAFNFRLDHFASSQDNDPYSDWLYFRLPPDETPGEDGYLQFVDNLQNGIIDGYGSEHLGRLVLMNWNRRQYESAPGAGDGPVNAMPENGTILRLSFAEKMPIDIKPSDTPNTVNCSNPNALVPVAILSDENFSATDIDPATVTFGPARATKIHNQAHLEDVNQDGYIDRVFHFRFQETGIQCGASTATIDGYTPAGNYFIGEDALHTINISLNCELDDPAEHDYNEVRLLVSNDGRLGRTQDLDAHAYFPGDKCETYMYTAGFWFGAVINGQPTVAEISHNSEFAPSMIGNTNEIFRVFNNKYGHDKQLWPPEFSHTNGSPLIASQAQNLVVEYNDLAGTPHRESGPLGIEVRQRSLAYQNQLLKNSLIIIWEIENISGQDINDAYWGFWSDTDIGNHLDDQSSIVNDMGIIWDHDFTEDGFAETPAIMGFDLLETPNDIGKTNFVTFVNGGPNSDPNSDAAQYEALAGVNNLETDIVADIRFLLTSGPFDLPYGEKIAIAGALHFARVPDGTSELNVNPENFYRPDPNDPILAALLQQQHDVRMFYDENLKQSIFSKANTVADQPRQIIPGQFAFYPCYPNPFNPATTIRYDLPKEGRVTIDIYNMLGQKVLTLENSFQAAGSYALQWQPEGLSSGIYLIALTAGDYQFTRKVLYLR